MAEPLSVVAVVASLIQLADFSTKLAYGSSTVAKQIKCAPRMLSSISREVALTGALLRQVSTELNHIKYQEVCNGETLKVISGLTKECEEVFNILDNVVGSESEAKARDKRGTFERWTRRIKLPGVINEMTQKRDSLCRIKYDLILMLQTLSLAVQRRQLAYR